MNISAPNYAPVIAAILHLKTSQTAAAIRLLDDGNTIPFIARYRKEMTGELDETQLRDIVNLYDLQKNLYHRKSDVARLLGELGVLDDPQSAGQLEASIRSATSLAELEDIYRPYRPKRKTRASVAKQKGLQPLSEWLTNKSHLNLDEAAVRSYAEQYVSEELGVGSADESLQGAADIIAEQVADDAEIRKWVRAYTNAHAALRSQASDPDAESVYELYYDYHEPIRKIVPHRVLAINRGEREGYLKVTVDAPLEEIIAQIQRRCFTSWFHTSTPLSGGHAVELLERAITDAYKRLIAPAIERELRTELTEHAEEHAIQVFGQNLSSLLLQPPIRGKTVLGVDPAYRTGCKLAVVDDTGKLLATTVIYPTPPQNKVEQAKETVFALLSRWHVDLIVIGNGTASRETETFIAGYVQEYKQLAGKAVPYAIVSEAGASVYSASSLAREEFPDLDVSERSAISIARRIQDPLAELVKIDPKSVGVGQYQHDVAEKKLDQKLADVIESAVNQVGVDVNTASQSLLSYVAGLNKTAAKNIVDFRDKNGRYLTRHALAKVPRLGPKTLEQCVGFLRIPDGEEILDRTPIHPETYPAVEKLFEKYELPADFFKDTAQRKAWIQKVRQVPEASLCGELGIGVPTLRDILDALERPGRDPREDVPPPVLRTDVLKLEDLQVGMLLTGTVRNVVDFGAFVDIGIKNDGLVHISQLSEGFVKHPMDVVSVGDIVQVTVIQVDAAKGRVGLSMKGINRHD